MITRRLSRNSALITVLLITLSTPLGAQMPMTSLDRDDPVYVQQQQMVQRPEEPLVLFTYTPASDEDLFGIAARLKLPYATIASLNRLDQPHLPEDRTPLLIPSHPGLFAPTAAATPLERRLLDRIGRSDRSQEIQVPASAGEESFLFAPGLDFSEAERDLFMQGAFMHPLGGGAVSSPFGYRYHPFSNARLFHTGIDFAVDFGTPVFAAADGVVQEINREPLLGLSVLVAHRGEYETMYAHLQEAIVTAGDSVRAGDTVGFVGSTGMSTGPHLHFEVRFRGAPRDPGQYILWE